MSERALQQFQEARQKLLEAQRTCSWCSESFDSSERLAQHVYELHRSRVELFVKEKDGRLCFLDSKKEIHMVLLVYPAGDCDTFSWPLDTSCRTVAGQHDDIVRAMYDEREMGNIPASVTEVILPDDTVLELNS